MSKCLDCGCSMDAGICSNCHEALYIQTFQNEYMEPASPEFIAEANKEAQAIKHRNKTIREDPAVFKDLKPSDDYYKERS